MKMKLSTKLLVILLLTSIIPLFIAGIVGYRSSISISQIAAEANQNIAALAMSDSMEALSQEKRRDLQARTESIARNINDILVRVEADTAELAEFGDYLYNNAGSVGRYGHPSVYGIGSNGTFGSIEENQNSWLMVSELGFDENGEISQALMDEIYLTEFLDIKFKSIANNNPYAVQLYLNTKSQFTRGMPFGDGEYIWVDATEQFPPDMDLTAFDFFYLADETHDPERVPVWTQLYWDPAGLGWMVSNVAPVYQADALQGVVGIDITLGKMVDEIINFQIEQTGFAFLMSSSGQAIAFPERASDFLGFKDSLEGNFGDDEEFSFFLNETNDAAFQAIIARMQAGEQDLATYAMPDEEGAEEFFFAYHPVRLTDWSVGIVVPVEEVIAPALSTNEQIASNMETTSQNIQERAREQTTSFALLTGAILLGLFPVALLFAKTISNPIMTLDEGAREIGAGDLAYRIRVNSGDEIEQLAQSFNQMAEDLQRKVHEIEAANEELQILDKLKSQFISMASHELRTPLIAIQGYADLIRDGETGEITKEQKNMLNTVSRNATRLARIVTELLDVSRIEENKLILRSEAFAISQVIGEIAEEHQPTIDARQHTLDMAIQDNLPLVMGDRDRIGQVIINLLSNAIKYTPDGGHIQIKAEAEGEHVHVSVSDNGIGIEEEHLDKIFSRFYEIGDVTQHRTSKSAFMAGGAGLGLAIVKGIVEAHGGTVWVESEHGQGSTFHVRLPGAEGVEEAIAPPVEEAEVYRVTGFEQETKAVVKKDGRLKILVIDDEEDAIAVTTRMLTDRYDMTGAQTSGTGLKATIADQPDLVLLDAWMPGISGYDVCQTLKNNHNTKDIPIIIFTAATQQADIEHAYAAGADGFITKPFKRDDLIKLIEDFRVSG